EGVACVDDVSRALVLWCDLWERTHERVAREWVDGLLAFCRWMQLDDGRFANFVVDWTGARNIDGLTSRADGASFWHARGARAIAGPVLGRMDLVEVARRSADAYLVPLIDRGFDLPMVQPYGAASAAFAMDQLGRATGDARYARAARDARAWFDGRNPAGRP